MRKKRGILYLLGLIGLALALSGCAPDGITPEPDGQANEETEQTRVAEAVAATLTAQAPLSQSETPAAATTVTETTAPPNTPETVLCTVVSEGLSVRSGPGLVYDPPLTSVPRQTELIPIAFNGAGFPGRWVQVKLPTNNLTGWVSADQQFINCTVDVTGLPTVEAPPTPSPTNTSTPLPVPPTATPTPFNEFVFSPEGGGGNRDIIKGQVHIPGYAAGSLDPLNLVFRDRLTMRVETYDIRSGRTSDGAGISRVQFTIEDDDGEVYFNEELSPAYCLFGGDDPQCPAATIPQSGYSWPDGTPVKNGKYDVIINIISDRGDTANWRFSFRIEGAPSELFAEFAQTGPDTTDTLVNGALAFQVRAYNPEQGNLDGDGIEDVDLRIFRNGKEVYERTESNAKYCAFSGGEPDCDIWVFSDHNNRWPGNTPIDFGPHILQARVNAKNGQQKVIELQVDIQP